MSNYSPNDVDDGGRKGLIENGRDGVEWYT